MAEQAATDEVDDARQAGSDSSQRLPLVVYVMAMGTFLLLTTEYVVAGLLSEVASDLGVSVARAGLLITVFALGMLVGAPSMALLTLRIPHRVTLTLALLVFSIGHVIVALSPDLTLVLGARFLTAVATGAFWAVSAVVAVRVSPASKGTTAVGIVSAGGTLATVLGVPLGALVGQAWGWRSTFWVLAVASLLVLVVIARSVPSPPAAKGATSLRGELAGLRSPGLWLTLATCVLSAGGVFSAYSYIAPLLTDEAGFAATRLPLLLALFGVGAFIGGLAASRVGEHRPHPTTIFAAAGTTVVLFAITMLAQHQVLMTILVGLLGLFGMASIPVLISMALRYAGDAPTLGSSLSVSAFNLGTAGSSWLGGLALESGLGAIGPAALGSVVMIFTLVAVITLAVWSRRNERLRRTDA